MSYVSDITNKPLQELLLVFMEHDLKSIILKHNCHPEFANGFQNWHNTSNISQLYFIHMGPTTNLENSISASLILYPDMTEK